MFRRILLSFAAALLATVAFAHAVVRPPESTAGQSQHYTLRVPNEKQLLTTTVQLSFPAELMVTAVDPKSDWKSDIGHDASGRIISATWTGSLSPGAEVEFTFSARNPATPVTLEWKVIQTFQDGSRSEWTGPQGSRTPASRTVIGPAPK